MRSSKVLFQQLEKFVAGVALRNRIVIFADELFYFVSESLRWIHQRHRLTVPKLITGWRFVYVAWRKFFTRMCRTVLQARSCPHLLQLVELLCNQCLDLVHQKKCCCWTTIIGFWSINVSDDGVYWLTDESIKLPLPPDVIVHCQEFGVVAATFLNKRIALNSLVNTFLNWLVDKRVVLCIMACLPVPAAQIAVVTTCLISSYIWWKLCFYLLLKEQVFNTFLHLLLQISAHKKQAVYIEMNFLSQIWFTHLVKLLLFNWERDFGLILLIRF